MKRFIAARTTTFELLLCADSRVLRLLRRGLAAAVDVAALLKEQFAVVNLVPQTRHAPSGPDGFWEVTSARRGRHWIVSIILSYLYRAF